MESFSFSIFLFKFISFEHVVLFSLLSLCMRRYVRRFQLKKLQKFDEKQKKDERFST